MNEEEEIDQISKSSDNTEDGNENASQEQAIEHSKTENMEVHHHPDMHHKKKNFKKYFLEFVMIFLAVTLGFFAEQIREGFVQRSEEKEYIQSFYEDLSSDERTLPALLNWVQRDIDVSDSLQQLLKKADLKTRANETYVDFRFLIRQL